VFGGVAVLVALNEESEFTLNIGSGDGSVGTDDGFTLGIFQGLWVRALHNQTRRDGNQRGFIFGQLEGEP
jgi:hypothetical protein